MGVYRFGKFELNEGSRSLRLTGRDVEVQPLVFDFMAMLLRHQDRLSTSGETVIKITAAMTGEVGSGQDALLIVQSVALYAY